MLANLMSVHSATFCSNQWSLQGFILKQPKLFFISLQLWKIVSETGVSAIDTKFPSPVRGLRHDPGAEVCQRRVPLPNQGIRFIFYIVPAYHVLQ